MRFLEALRRHRNALNFTVIPDFKRVSPKEGELFRGRDPVRIARELAQCGAPVLSVVTEEKNFGGSLRLLREIASAVTVPVLRKDFIRTREDLVQTAETGAAAVLLIAVAADREALAYLYREALTLGLDPLVEVHSEEEIAFARALGAELLGINNRDILELERDEGGVSTTRRLASLAPKQAYLISESGLMTREDIREAVSSSADAGLVGTALWQAQDVGLQYRRLCRKTQVKICGLMEEEGISLCEKAGVDTLGFVAEYPIPVPWNLTRERAAALISRVRGSRTCVVTGGSPEKVLDLARCLRPDVVQLHYRETLEETRTIARELKKICIDTIKTLPLERSERLAQFGAEDAGEIVRLLEETEIAAILVDARGPGNAALGGGASPFAEFCVVKSLARKRVILAGGLTPGNILGALEETGAESVDLMTGTEDAPGVKSEGKIRALMAKLEGLQR